ncbi:MAG: DUF1289 domain-containing protein [Betaproteobacteria bacterium]|nr:DUF1289 domain-containing protein [Betaproteobacteria bacterium]
MDLRRAQARALHQGGPRHRRETGPGRRVNAMVKSPCVEICQIDAAHGLCIGCHRTLDEIARWSNMSNAERRSVLARLPARRLAGDAIQPETGR